MPHTARATRLTAAPALYRPQPWMPTLSITVGDLPPEDPMHYAQIADDWWVIMIRSGILNGEAIPAYVDRFAGTRLWPTLTTIFGADPLISPDRVAALYPDDQPVRTGLIPEMEDARILAPLRPRMT